MTDTAAPSEPHTDAEWHAAVDAAAFWLLIEDARAYGLVTGGPTVDRDRCELLLLAGRRRGIFPKKWR